MINEIKWRGYLFSPSCQLYGWIGGDLCYVIEKTFQKSGVWRGLFDLYRYGEINPIAESVPLLRCKVEARKDARKLLLI